jgi:hypothetical protein
MPACGGGRQRVREQAAEGAREGTPTSGGMRARRRASPQAYTCLRWRGAAHF